MKEGKREREKSERGRARKQGSLVIYSFSQGSGRSERVDLDEKKLNTCTFT